ncbi:MAG: hypothetical protein HYZ81_22810 [Nitrospinae bacterium]|nr:hypothetical protein [Nitrospinota bacterium]
MPLDDFMRLLIAVSILLVAVAAVVVLVKLAMLLDNLREKIDQIWPTERGRERT